MYVAMEACDSYRAIHQRENQHSAQTWRVDQGLSPELRTRFARLAVLALAVLGLAMLATPSSILGDDEGPESAPLGPPDVVSSKPKYLRLDSQLNQIVDQLGQATPRSLAESAPISQGSSVAVTVRLSDNVGSLVEFLDANAATVANVGSDYIEAYVPVTALTHWLNRTVYCGSKRFSRPRPQSRAKGRLFIARQFGTPVVSRAPVSRLE